MSDDAMFVGWSLLVLSLSLWVALAGCSILDVPCNPVEVQEEVIYVEGTEITTVERTDSYEECVLKGESIGWRYGYPAVVFTYECRCEL